jgi:hypothetical protein
VEGAEFGDSDLLSTGVIANSDDRGSGALRFHHGLTASGVSIEMNPVMSTANRGVVPPLSV